MNSSQSALFTSHMLRWVPFRNDSGETIPANSVIRITGQVDVDSRSVFTASKPNTYGAQFHHAITATFDVPDGGYGECTFDSGVGAVYDSADGTPAFGEVWGPRDSTWKLKKNTGGFLVVGNPDTTNFLVEVQRCPMLEFVGKTDGSHAKGATGTISIYTGTLGSETDTTVNMTGVYNRFAALASGKWVRCVWNWWTLSWELLAAEC